MSNKIHACLAFGFALPKGEQLPNGVNVNFTQYGVSINRHKVSHQAGDEIYVVTVDASSHIASTRDVPEHIHISDLIFQSEWLTKLAKFCNQSGIQFRHPGWILYVSWDE